MWIVSLKKRKRRRLRSTSSTCSHQWKLSDLVPSLVPSCSRPRPTDRGLAALSLRECGERRNGVPLVTASPGTCPRWTSRDMAMDDRPSRAGVGGAAREPRASAPGGGRLLRRLLP